jgi:superfamily II DNA or RNA helicase
MPGLRLVKRDPDKAYVSNNLWLPKRLIPIQAIKEGLQYWDVEKGSSVLKTLWSETRDHLICPREYIKPEQYTKFPFPFIDITPKRFPKAHFFVKNEPRDDDQRAASRAFETASGGILNLACGKGKTFLALKQAEFLGCPLLVVVHNTFLMNQWVHEAIPNHVELRPNHKVGVIQGERFDWKHPITVAMIHSLASRLQDGKIPPEMWSHFGMVVFDEVHHLSAPLFVTTAPIIQGRRYGLTATDKRGDGTDFIYKMHIGDIFYSDLRQKLLPRIYFQYTPVYCNPDNVDEAKDSNGEYHLGKFRSYFGTHPEALAFRQECLQYALDDPAGRKILAVSHSKDQLLSLHERFPGSGLIVQETPQEDRSSIVRRSRLTFAIANLGFEGLDDDNIDTVHVLLPFGSEQNPPNDLQQVLGRAQREKTGKNTPVVVIYDDVNVKPLHKTCMTMRKQLSKWDKHVPGMPALTFKNLPVVKR